MSQTPPTISSLLNETCYTLSLCDWSLAVVAGMKKTNDQAEPTNVER